LSGFCRDYLLTEKQVCTVFRGNKITEREKEKLKLHKDFDTEKDFLLLIVGPSPENLFSLNKQYKRLDIKEYCVYKCLLKVSKPVFVSGLYLYKPWYEENTATYRDFTFMQINNMPEEFSKVKEDKTKPAIDKKRRKRRKLLTTS